MMFASLKKLLIWRKISETIIDRQQNLVTNRMVSWEHSFVSKRLVSKHNWDRQPQNMIIPEPQKYSIISLLACCWWKEQSKNDIKQSVIECVCEVCPKKPQVGWYWNITRIYACTVSPVFLPSFVDTESLLPFLTSHYCLICSPNSQKYRIYFKFENSYSLSLLSYPPLF